MTTPGHTLACPRFDQYSDTNVEVDLDFPMGLPTADPCPRPPRQNARGVEMAR